jgi:hypothetical protein
MDMYKFRPDSKQTSPLLQWLYQKSSSASPTDFMKILGDLPSSNVTGIIFSVAYCITKRPVGVEPVNAAFDTFFVCYQRSSKLSTKTINNIHSWRKDIPSIPSKLK